MIAPSGYGEAGSFPHSSIIEECRCIQWESLDIAREKNRILIKATLAQLKSRRKELLDSDCWHQTENADRVLVDHYLARLAPLLEVEKKKP
ncbi:MAG: hypothetical protein WEC84_02860 [Candidatus Andersenbacteria bacterium]